MSRDDRAQRLLLGAMLMALNLYGMSHGATWNQWVALAVQLDLLVTGLAGWCPMAMT